MNEFKKADETYLFNWLTTSCQDLEMQFHVLSLEGKGHVFESNLRPTYALLKKARRIIKNKELEALSPAEKAKIINFSIMHHVSEEVGLEVSRLLEVRWPTQVDNL
jgi:hypothetical protein